jgi:lysozyme family protein
MTARNFQAYYDFIEAPDNDGQPFHITEGDPGGATVYGWTYVIWQRVAPLHGIEDRMFPGIDLFWADFQFGSGGATKVLQAALGVKADGVVGMTTIGVANNEPDKHKLLDKLLAARMAYYDRCGFRNRWPGLYRRAIASHALALTLAVPTVPSPTEQRLAA